MSKERIWYIVEGAIVVLCVVGALAMLVCCLVWVHQTNTPNVEDTSTSAPAPSVSVEQEIVYVDIKLESAIPTLSECTDKDDLARLLIECDERSVHLFEILEYARAVNYPEDHPIIEFVQEEIDLNRQLHNTYWTRYIDLGYLKWDERMEEYPIATSIWLRLKDFGYSDYVCAGILGNIMVEVGGKTLDLSPLTYNPAKTYYGICQWSRHYYPQIDGAPLDIQCEFLHSTLPNEMDVFGSLYARGFDYEDFCALTNVRSAALAFAKCYERSGPAGYLARQDCAQIAFEYFTK